MLLLLLSGTPEGYGAGPEPMIYLSFLLPAVFLAAIWWLGRNTV